MRDCFLFFLIFILFSLPVSAYHDNHDAPIRVGIFPLEPINFIDQKGTVQGLYPDLLRAIVEKEGWAIEFVPGTWAQGLDRLQTGEIDLVTTIAKTPERAKVMDFNRETVFSIWGQVFLRPETQVETILDLEGLKVAIIDRDISGQNFIQTLDRLGVACEILRYPLYEDVFVALQNHEVDAGVTPNHFGLRHSSKYGLVPSSIQFSPISLYFATKTGRFSALLEHIDEHLLRWKADKNSYYYQRMNYWMGAEGFEKEIIPLWLLICLGLVGLVATVLFFASMAFKVQVKKAVEERRSQERDYRRLVQNVSNIILRVDSKSNIRFINRYGLAFFGFSEKELIGKSVVGTIVPQQESRGRKMDQFVHDILRDPDNFATVENENICKDGRRVFIQWRNQPEYDDAGNVVGLLSVGADISDRIQIEAVLRAKEEKFRTLFENVTDYALILQLREDKLVIVDLNEAACRQHGYQREELVGKPLSLLDTEKVPEDEERLNHLALGETLIFEVTHQRKDGTTFPVEVISRPLEIDGELFLFSIERDLTQQKQSEKEKDELQKSLQQKFKMEAIGNLAGGIAHDFNNILAIIIGTAGMMQRKFSPDDGNLTKLESILNAANRAKNLVNQVLAFSRQQEQTLVPLQFSELIEDTATLLRATISRTVELNIVIAPECKDLKVKADPTQLQQVLINLCSNAVHAMDEKGVINIELQKSPQSSKDLGVLEPLSDDYLRLSITDTGSGMSTDQIERIFDPFYTTKDIGQGTGMGLAVVHGIVESHHGYIHVDSQVGEGTRFQIYMPLTCDEVPTVVAANGPLPEGSERILFVDDEEDLTLWAEELFLQQGFRPTCCVNSPEALAMLRADPQSFDLLITDQSMPELSGLELIAEAKKIRPDLPVILCSGFSTRVTSESAKRLGINHFFNKPYQEDQLLTAVRHCLDTAALA